MNLSPEEIKLDNRSIYLRELALRTLKGGRRGHIGSTFSLIEIFRVIYDDFVDIDLIKVKSRDRDKVILSKGHGCIAQYVMLAEKGLFALSELDTFCGYDSILGGHPERGHIPGIEASTGSLGHGLPIGVGIAYGQKIRELNSKTIVILGDGEIQEGSNWEALFSANKHLLNNLILIVDSNKLQSFDTTSSVWDVEPLIDKFKAFNCDVSVINGHNIVELKFALNQFKGGFKPKVIIANTIKGKGFKVAEGNPLWHHKAKISDFEIEKLTEMLKNA
jgi:transketolase